MNFNSWLDKYRIIIGIILIVIIGIGVVFLFWGDKLIKKDNGQGKDVAVLESRISELENKILSLEGTQGQVAGASNDNNGETLEPQEESKQSLININTASLAELDKLPGVGPTRAQYIIEYRESHGNFKTTAEIQNIKGIGQATYDKLKDMITIE